MSGKDVCHYLKEVRRKIAEENDIPFEITECSFKGECSGTCPKCESEVRYLEQQLSVRKSLAKKAAVVGIAVGLSFAGSPHVAAQTDSLYTDPMGYVAPQFGKDAPGCTEGLFGATVWVTQPHLRSQSLQTSDVARPFRGSLTTLDYGNYDKSEIQSAPPKFVGGETALRQFVETNLQYPEEAQKMEIEGDVKLKVRLAKSGVVKSVKVIQRVHPLLDAEAARVALLMPNWEPAYFDNRPISTQLELTIEFRLKK